MPATSPHTDVLSQHLFLYEVVEAGGELEIVPLLLTIRNPPEVFRDLPAPLESAAVIFFTRPQEVPPPTVGDSGDAPFDVAHIKTWRATRLIAAVRSCDQCGYRAAARSRVLRVSRVKTGL